MRVILPVLLLAAVSAVPLAQDARRSPPVVGADVHAGPKRGGYIVERDADVMKKEPAPHKGGGDSVGYNFFGKAEGFKFAFRKRALKPGAAIGYHLQKEDEVYYILSGRGVMTIDDTSFNVGPGTAILTRPGSSHGLKQAGDEDLVLLINYEVHR